MDDRAPAWAGRDAKLEPEDGVPRLWWNAAAPILLTIVTVILGLMVTGWITTSAAGPGWTLAKP